MAIQSSIAMVTSVAIRLGAYFFLRWALLPPIPPVVFTLFAVNVPAFVLSHLRESPYDVVGEKVDVTVTDVVLEDADGHALDEAEEVDVTDTLVLRPKAFNPWRALVLGAPSPSKLLSLLIVLTNAVLVAMIADRVYMERAMPADDLSFARLGYISNTEARLLIREPDQAKMPVTVDLRLKNPEPPFDSPLWHASGGVRWTDNSTDFTAVLPLPLPHPQQRTYEWRTSNNHSGEFTAGPAPGAVPVDHGGNFTFVATSCMVSRVPYNPYDHPLAIPGTRALARVLPSLGAQFMLFLGDFIYADVPRWWGGSVVDYRRKYRQVYASPDWQPIAQNLSWIHVLDDHEIFNDWSANQTGVYTAAVDPYRHYHMAANPPEARQAAPSGTDVLSTARPGATYFQFTQGPASFFLLDTRSFRSSNSLAADDANKTMLGAGQLADLLAFLRQPSPPGVRWKIVASSVPFTKNWHVNGRDTWGGFLAERRIILEAMWDAGLHGTGVVVLSGDRHEFAATRFPPPAANASRWPASVAVHEFSASPLSQFYSPVPTYWQTDDEDVKLRYINRGNSKFGAVTILPPSIGGSDSGAQQSRLHYRLFVDGAPAWETTIEGPEPVASAEPAPAASFWGKLFG